MFPFVGTAQGVAGGVNYSSWIKYHALNGHCQTNDCQPRSSFVINMPSFFTSLTCLSDPNLEVDIDKLNKEFMEQSEVSLTPRTAVGVREKIRLMMC